MLDDSDMIQDVMLPDDVSTGTQQAEETVADVVADEPQQPTSVTITIPIAPAKQGAYEPRRLDARVSRKQGGIAMRVARALNDSNTRLANGKHVCNRGDFVKWLLDQIADALDAVDNDDSDNTTKPGK